MKKSKDRLIGLSCSLIFCLIIFAGCATKEAVKSQSDEEVLRERVAAYWNHKIKGEFDKSYEFESPLYRKQVSLVRYSDSFNTGSRIQWVGMGIDTLTVNGDSASIKIRVKVSIDSGRPGKRIEPETAENEQWVKVEGVWYHVPQKVK